MEYNTHVICSKTKIRNTFFWEKIFSASEHVQKSQTSPHVWVINGLCLLL